MGVRWSSPDEAAAQGPPIERPTTAATGSQRAEIKSWLNDALSRRAQAADVARYRRPMSTPADGGPPAVGASTVSPIPKATGGLTYALTVMLVACCATSLLGSVLFFRLAALASRLVEGDRVRRATLRAVTSSTIGALEASVALLVVTGVVFMVWFWRVIKNAQVIERATAGRSGAAFPAREAPAAGWAVGSWLVPVGGLFLPALFMARVDRVSGQAGLGARPLIACWAATWGMACVLFVFVVPPTTGDFATWGFAFWRGGVVELVFALSALLATLMVRRITRRQVRAIDLLRAAAS